ncbi:MAG: M2 family metallopeptidase [Candidatus Krumholzibacteriota bacterium]|nr:M2 family metallopeptidase [Candidatus Krumholzibacteriota bacterium]
MEFKKFVDRHVARIRPLEKAGALAYWNAALSGNQEDVKKYSEIQLELEKIYTDAAEFNFVKKFRESMEVQDGQLSRMADLLYLRYVGNQVDSALLQEIVNLSGTVENKFAVYRTEIDGKELTSNQVLTILREEKDCAHRRRVWEANKRVGRVVAGDLLKLINLRNESARAVGFDNYYSMSLTLAEQDEEELVSLFAELEKLTRDPFLELKRRFDAELAEGYSIKPEEMRPWHYHDPFFQEAPADGRIDLNRYYRNRDIVELVRTFYAGIGMPVEDILERSDLYERKGKNPHAFCTDIDREGDIRILCNLKNDKYWMETLLHELGHGVYDKYIDPALPYLLRIYPHIALTEATAMYFGRLSQDPGWMSEALGLDDREAAKIAPSLEKSLRLKMMVFARWVQTMFNFERQLYRDPEQDLNRLWWDMVERYQFVPRPEGRSEPDWATKIHVVMSPVYYHNYMLGEMIASQIHHHVKEEVLTRGKSTAGIYGNTEVGEYFKEVVFKPGNLLPLSGRVKAVTGEALSPRYFVEQFVKEQA